MAVFRVHFMAVFLVGVTILRGASAAENVGDALADLPDAALWNWKVMWLMPRNVEDFRAACERAQVSLKPGESRKYRVLMTVNLLNNEPVRFQGLAPADQDIVTRENVRSVGFVTLERSRFLAAGPMAPFSREVFGKVIKPLSPELTYEDHEFAVRAANIQVGHPAGPAGPKLIDLLDRTARAGAAGRVILVAKADDPQYSVYNERTGKVERYGKGPELKKLGHTVWVHAKESSGRGYTLVVSQLASAPALAAGDEVKAGQTLGSFGEKEGLFYAVWRADQPSQHFLKGGAYRVSPIFK